MLILRQLPEAAAELEARVLLGFVLRKPQSHLYAWPERPLDAERLRTFAALVRRRARGEPLAYITGRREFWSLDLDVGPATLIPRQETELLVERALRHIPAQRVCTVADLGTGSGAVALAIAAERPRCRVTATDISAAALEIARQNARRLGLSNLQMRQGNWFDALPHGDSFDLIVGNPPYVASADPRLAQGDPAWEPAAALQAGMDGLDAIRAIAAGARSRLTGAGRLLLEHGCDQGPEVREILHRAGIRDLQTHADLAGRDRVTEGKP